MLCESPHMEPVDDAVRIWDLRPHIILPVKFPGQKPGPHRLPGPGKVPPFFPACDHPGTGIRHPLAVALEAVFHIFKIISL